MRLNATLVLVLATVLTAVTGYAARTFAGCGATTLPDPSAGETKTVSRGQISIVDSETETANGAAGCAGVPQTITAVVLDGPIDYDWVLQTGPNMSGSYEFWVEATLTSLTPAVVWGPVTVSGAKSSTPFGSNMSETGTISVNPAALTVGLVEAIDLAGVNSFSWKVEVKVYARLTGGGQDGSQGTVSIAPSAENPWPVVEICIN